MKLRFVKIVRSDGEDIGSVEEKINDTVRRIAMCGGKIVSFSNETFGLSPMNMFVFIIYESETELTDTVINQRLQETGDDINYGEKKLR
ncbi:MAG: hypothetical protein NC548_52180 [Lachnospiraceae bacterium]|nr:hypothetical protein [Lachnospiraceae bacterium]MCM1231560.1 hypothetical protein [Ruminococcus flavefaciens]